MTRSQEVTSRIMSAVRSHGTRPELLLRHELHRRGLRYRLKSGLAGKPDIVFPSARVACFVDGDRWHGNGWRIRGFSSFEEEFQHANSQFWKQKIERNIERDRQVDSLLLDAGWSVVRIWASEVERDISNAADRVESIVRARRGARS